MCGIFGGHEKLLKDFPHKILNHRGPDQFGQIKVNFEDKEPIIIGNTRLSIVNREPIKLPLEENGWTISFNGEIYNWREIRKKLEFEGHKFFTNTDTEVVLKALRYWGEDALNLFNGMFAIAIWDGMNLKLIRDRVGIKPLFYSHINDKFSFASEIKAFKYLEYLSVDICKIMEFYFDEHTPYSDIKSLRPGEIITWNSRNNSLNSRKWWSFPDYDGSITDQKSAVEEFIDLFSSACNIRKIADVPVTVFQSGGIDSSLIQAVVRSEETFTVEFKEFEDQIVESIFTEEMSKKLLYKNKLIIPTREEFLKSFPKLAFHQEFQVGSFSIFPLYCLSKAAKDNGYKVALTGEGADELFNGYFRNEVIINEEENIQKYNKLGYGPLANRYFGNKLDRISRISCRSSNSENIKKVFKLLEEIYTKELNIYHNLANIELSLFIQPLLAMADRMSMANSIEVRNPFLDFRVIEFSTKLSPELRFKNNTGKYILKLALKELLKGQDLAIFNRKVKHGLPSPVNYWLFSKKSFIRDDWNKYLQSECVKQIKS